MTGPEHYAEAVRLLAVADRQNRGVTYGQEWTLTLTAAQVHAMLALAAATAVGTTGPDRHAWADVARYQPQRQHAGGPKRLFSELWPRIAAPPALFPPPDDRPGPSVDTASRSLPVVDACHSSRWP
jgi:hypothetical protein